MTITRAQIKFEIWTRLNKSATTKGFYTDDKVNLAVQECLDYVGTEQILADDGWAHKIDYLDTQSNVVTVPVPPHVAMIYDVRYLVGNVYTPILYDQEFDKSQWSGASGVVQFPSRYRLVDNQFYFNPPIGVGGPKYLQVEYAAYPKKLQRDADALDQNFDRAMYYYIIYRACSILAGTVGQMAKAWKDEETAWYSRMLDMIYMRNRQVTPIKEFQGW